MTPKSSVDRLRFNTTAVRKNGEWNVFVESAVSEITFAANHTQLTAALELATEEAAEEAQHYLGEILEGSNYVH